MQRLRFDDDVYPKFAFYFIISKTGKNILLSRSTTTTGLRNLQKTDFDNIIMPLPPLPEQKKIAAVLSAVQEAKEKTEAVIRATRELKKSLMKHLFTYGPVPLQEAENVPLKETEIGLVPEEWEVGRLGDVAKVTSGGSAPQGKESFNGQNPFVRVQHLELESDMIRRWDLVTDEAVDKCGLKLYPQGTIVFPKSGASIYLEKRAILSVDAYVVSHLCALISESPLVDQNFLFHYLRFLRLSEGKAEGYPTLNLTEIKNSKIACPPLPEQKKIADILSALDREIEAEENKKKALEELFRTLLSDLMTGKIRVNRLEVEA